MAMAKAAASSSSSSSPLCSICWEEVSDTCGRTVVRLQCSHSFHLDCIGSAFNVSGVMQCPNCREVEHGVWRRFENNTEENGDEESDEEDERNHDHMINHHCPGRNWCPRHGRIVGLPHAGRQNLAEQSPVFTGDHHLYGPSMITNISPSQFVLNGHNLVHPALLTPVSDNVMHANTLVALATARAPQCDGVVLPNFESAGHGAILQPAAQVSIDSLQSARRGSNGFPVWLPVPVPVPAQNIPLPPQQVLCHVPSFNLTLQNNPQAAEPVDHSLSLSIQNYPSAPPLVNHHPGERFETIQLLPDDMGPFRAPRN